MATPNIKNFPNGLRRHRSVAQEVHLLELSVEAPEPLSILELRGLGKEIWEGIDAASHVEEERRSWD